MIAQKKKKLKDESEENIVQKKSVAILERTHDERLHQHSHYYCRFLEIAMTIYFLFFYKSG